MKHLLVVIFFDELFYSERVSGEVFSVNLFDKYLIMIIFLSDFVFFRHFLDS